MNIINIKNLLFFHVILSTVASFNYFGLWQQNNRRAISNNAWPKLEILDFAKYFGH